MPTRVLAALAVLALGAAPPPPAGFDFVSKHGRYSAVFPAEPKVARQDIPLGFAVATIHQAMCDFGRRAYGVSHNDYKKEAMAGTPEQVLVGVQKGNVRAGKLVADKAVTFGPRKLPARAFTYALNGYVYRVLVVLDGVRLYQVLAGSDRPDDLTGPDAERLFSTFKIAADK